MPQNLILEILMDIVLVSHGIQELYQVEKGALVTKYDIWNNGPEKKYYKVELIL